MIGQGTWYLERGDRASAVAALRRGLDLGMNHIDTAEYYGEAENVVGDAISGRRNQVIEISREHFASKNDCSRLALERRVLWSLFVSCLSNGSMNRSARGAGP